MGTIYQGEIEYSGGGATVYSDMGGATSSTAGVHGLVPAPASGDNTKFLRGDGTWANAGGGNHTYSTAEQVVGKWINGSTVYERFVDFTNVSISSGSSDIKYKGDLMIKSIITDADMIFPDVQHSYYEANNVKFSFVGFRVNNSTGELVVATLFNVSDADLHICVQYTKTSSNNRSLTRSTAPISEETSTEEEIPFEPEKTVETPETEEENER